MALEIETPTNDENFEAAFARMSQDEPAEAAPEKVDPPAAPDAELTAAEPAAEADAAPAAEAEAAAEPETAPEPAVEAEAPKEGDDVLKRLSDMLKSAPKVEPEPTRQAAPAATAPEPAQAPPLYTAEETAFLSEYEKDYPDVAKAEGLRRRGEYNQLVSHIFNEIKQHYAPIVEQVQAVAARAQYTDLTSSVTDYEDVRDKVVDWAAKQPAYLQSAYQHVIAYGTVDEVVDLIDRYKRDTGATIAAPTAPKKADTELPTATKKAAAALAPVSSKRSAVTASDDPNDFEAAFASFASKV